MNCAILVVGSLLWEEGPRETWRQSRLELSKRQSVAVPIRYGRRSVTRANTFTVVLDPASGGGRGMLVPCSRGVESTEDLVDEAEALWRAERNVTAGHGICAEWGCVGALFRPEGLGLGLIAAWSDYFRSTASPIPPVDDDGILQIPWPTSVVGGIPADTNIILATATRAEPGRPAASQIADAWIDQDQGKERYFFQNVRHWIRTSDDADIGARIRERAPAWVDSDPYPAVLRQLESEG
jgi:hypothetical protein